LIGAGGGTSWWSTAEVDAIFGVGIDVAYGLVAGFVEVFDFLAGLGGARMSVVVALWVMRLCEHEIHR